MLLYGHAGCSLGCDIGATSPGTDQWRVKTQRVLCRLAATGKGAETVFRDRVTGKVVTKDEYAASKAAAARKVRRPESLLRIGARLSF
jgi:hypothetical protein